MPPVPDPKDTAKANKEIVRRMLKAFNDGDAAAIKELLHPEIKDHSKAIGLEPELRRGPVLKRVQTEIRREKEAFPDGKFKEEHIVAEGDKVILHWTMTGTHKGPFVGKPATGKKVAIKGTEIVTIKDGKIIEHDDDPSHVLDLLRQVGQLTPEMLDSPEFK